MRFPGEDDLPRGTVRDFAGFLFWLYRQAHRPTLREISDRITRSGLDGTASPETIRRMLQGATVPANWAIVEAVYLTFCDLADLDPDVNVDFEGDRAYLRDHVEQRWHRALDEPMLLYDPPASAARFADDPWAADGSEPPF